MKFPASIEPKSWFQIYRGAYRGTAEQKRAQLDKDVAALAKLSCVGGVIFHGFPRELLPAIDGLVALAKKHQIKCAFSWGLDGSRDVDGSRLTAKEKGECVGEALQHDGIEFGLLDAEGKWDTTVDSADDMNDLGAIELCEAMRKRAPSALVGDQPWFAIQKHGDEKRVVDLSSIGGTFTGFPSDEFAYFIDFRSPQVYFNDFMDLGKSRLEKIVSWHEKEWQLHDKSLERKSLRKPRTYTLQGYKSDDITSSYAALLWGKLIEEKPVIHWCDPTPSAHTIIVCEFLQKLFDGYVRCNSAWESSLFDYTLHTVVQRWQSDYNGALTTGEPRLDCDGIIGPKTLRAFRNRHAALFQ